METGANRPRDNETERKKKIQGSEGWVGVGGRGVGGGGAGGFYRGVYSCHGCMIITDSSVIEDLLTTFH